MTGNLRLIDTGIAWPQVDIEGAKGIASSQHQRRYLDGVEHKTPRLQVVLLVRDPPRMELRVAGDILLRYIRRNVCADREFTRWCLHKKAEMS